MGVLVDVAIGLVLMYVLLSLMVTTIVEIISTIASFRAKSLANAIEQLIDDQALRERFYKHGLIGGAMSSARGGSAPSAKATEDGKPGRRDHPSYIDGRAFAMALLDSLATSKSGDAVTVPQAAQLVKTLPDGKIRDVLLASLAEAGTDMGKLRDSVAESFDGAMDRLSGSFARFSKGVALFVGLIVAVAFNADTIAVTKILWTDEKTRSLLVDAAAKMAEDKSATEAALTACPAPVAPAPAAKPAETPAGAPAGQPAAPAAGPAEVERTKAAGGQDEQRVLDRAVCLADVLNTRQAALQPLPIGWTFESQKTFRAGLLGLDADAWLKLLGIAFTGLALSLGAPFWFDLLQKIMSLRGTGPKPAKTAEKA